MGQHGIILSLDPITRDLEEATFPTTNETTALRQFHKKITKMKAFKSYSLAVLILCGTIF